MIITALGDLVYNLLNLLLVFELPVLPESLVSIADSGIGYLVTGASLLRSFLGSTALGVIALLIQLLLLMHAAYMLFTFVQFILKKIPVLNVKM